MPTPAKTLLLIRHAHRDTSNRNLDNGLSDKGQKQVRRLIKYFQKRFKYEKWPVGQILFESSPKLRCVQTLAPLAQILSTEMKEQPQLLEQSAGESFAKFQSRLHAYIQAWIESPEQVRIICGHGDSLPLMVYHLLGAAVEFKKGGFLEIEWESGQAHLKQYIPSLKAFYD